MERNFKHAGFWGADKEIHLIEKNGEIFALNEKGWNGEKFYNCWKCTGKYNMTASDEEYIIKPIYEEVKEDEFEVIDYEIERD